MNVLHSSRPSLILLHVTGLFKISDLSRYNEPIRVGLFRVLFGITPQVLVTFRHPRRYSSLFLMEEYHTVKPRVILIQLNSFFAPAVLILV